MGGAGELGGWVGVLPRAQEWCGCDRDLGSSGTWLALEFYCVPARAWHSHASEYGTTEGRKGSKEGRKGGGEQSSVGKKQMKEGVWGGGVGALDGQFSAAD